MKLSAKNWVLVFLATITAGLAGCGGGGGGGGPVTLQVAGFSGTWKLDVIVLNSTCGVIPGIPGSPIYINMENTGGKTVKIWGTDEAPETAQSGDVTGQTLHVVGAGAHAGDEITATLNASGTSLTGQLTGTDTAAASGPCSTTFSFTGTKQAAVANVPQGEWTITLQRAGGTDIILPAAAFTQEHASLRQWSSTSDLNGILLPDNRWTGSGTFSDGGSSGEIDEFNGTFNGTAFSGNWSGSIDATAVSGMILGVQSVSSGVMANMVPILPGTFEMGSNNGSVWERAVHTVTITRPFWMGKYEVTQAEYQALVGWNPSWYQGTNKPVERVGWTAAMAYCMLLTVQEAAAGRLPLGYQYRLPTEAEWEYCCRAGTTNEWNTGGSLSCGQANFFATSACYLAQTNAVGSYAANAWGLHDMHGNVREWCLDSGDFFLANYSAGSVSDPYVSSGPLRVIRGGSFASDSLSCRSASREWSNPEWRFEVDGFRVVLAPVLVQ